MPRGANVVRRLTVGADPFGLHCHRAAIQGSDDGADPRSLEEQEQVGAVAVAHDSEGELCVPCIPLQPSNQRSQSSSRPTLHRPPPVPQLKIIPIPSAQRIDRSHTEALALHLLRPVAPGHGTRAEGILPRALGGRGGADKSGGAGGGLGDVNAEGFRPEGGPPDGVRAGAGAALGHPQSGINPQALQAMPHHHKLRRLPGPGAEHLALPVPLRLRAVLRVLRVHHQKHAGVPGHRLVRAAVGAPGLVGRHRGHCVHRGKLGVHRQGGGAGDVQLPCRVVELQGGGALALHLVLGSTHQHGAAVREILASGR
mmetsp:Transcript_46116/g.104526  ORF Transcript_46116/g.104526 Transcript_46116/m.104526 type:complete len:312 (-) Transcript_46116:230-1165(-)